MASDIDTSKPEEGDATTESVRENFSNAKTEIEALQESKTEWVGQWVEGTYPKNTQLRVGYWTVISNKETSDYPVPHFSGEPECATDTFPDTIEDDFVIYSGNKYVLLEDKAITALGAMAPQSTGSSVYTIRLRVYTTDPTDGLTYMYENVPLEVDQPLSFNISPVVALAGQTVEVVMASNNAGSETSYTNKWEYQGKETLGVDEGQWNLNPGNTLLRINQTTSDSELVYSQLSQVGADSIVTVTDPNDAAKYVKYLVTENRGMSIDNFSFVVTAIESGAAAIDIGSVTDINYTVPEATNNKISLAVDWWNPAGSNIPAWASSVEGLLQFGSDSQPGVETNAYAVDFTSQKLIKSDDWDVVSYSGATIAGDSANTVTSIPEETAGGTVIKNMLQMTQAEYDVSEQNADTFYVIPTTTVRTLSKKVH